MKNQTDELRTLIRSADPDGRQIVDPTIDPARRGYYDVLAGGDPEQVRRMVDTLLDKLDALEEALRSRVAAGSAVRR